jgi:chitinase
MLGHGFTRYWDDAAVAPYLYNAETQEFVSYDDAQSLAAKCAYIRTHNLGGVMFWHYSDDPFGVLLETINRALRQTPANARRVLPRKPFPRPAATEDNADREFDQ